MRPLIIVRADMCCSGGFVLFGRILSLLFGSDMCCSGGFAIRPHGVSAFAMRLSDYKSDTHCSGILGQAKRHPYGCRATNPAEQSQASPCRCRTANSDAFRFILMHSDPLRSTPMHSDLFRSIPIYSDLFRSTPIHSDPLRSIPIPSDERATSIKNPEPFSPGLFIA